MVQHIDIKLPHRIETGSLKIGDDWTGYFIRGDNAIYLCQALDNILYLINHLDSNADKHFIAIHQLDLHTVQDFADALRKV